MIVLSNSTDQTLQPGQLATFNLTVLHTGCAECHRDNTGAVGLRANNAVYAIDFHCNVSGATAALPLQLAIAMNGAPLLETTMISTPSAADVFNNIGTSTKISTCCSQGGGGFVTVMNTGVNPVTIGANPNLTIKRDA